MKQKLLIAGFVLALLACSMADEAFKPKPTTEPRPTVGSTERPLMSFDFEDVCLRGPVDGVPDYNPVPGSGGIHPVVVMYQYRPDAMGWSYMYPSSLKFPIPWIIDTEESDFTTAELVACADMVEATFSQECTGYTDDDKPGEEFTLRLYDVTYEVTVYTASTAEALGTQLFEASYDECPSFAIFSDPVEDRYASLPANPLKDYLEQYIEP